MIINKNWQFDFCYATANLFTYECFNDDRLCVIVDVFSLKYVQFDSVMIFEELLAFDQFDVYYDCELIEWAAI